MDTCTIETKPDTLYVAAATKSTNGRGEYVQARMWKNLGIYTNCVQYAYISTMKKVEKKVKTLFKTNPDMDVVIRPLTTEELAKYEDHLKTIAQIKAYRNSTTRMDAYLYKDNSSVTIYLGKKSGSNETDKALMGLFAKMGLTLRQGKGKQKFVVIKI